MIGKSIIHTHALSLSLTPSRFWADELKGLENIQAHLSLTTEMSR